MAALKEDKIVDLKKSSTLLNKLKSSTNKLLLNLVKELPSIPRPSGKWTKSFLMVLKRDNTSIIFSKLITLMSAPQLSIDNIQKGYLSIAPIDLARAVKFKERRKSKLPSIPKEAKKGRSYEDFQNYLSLHQLDSWLEMDTVMGRTGGKVLLTLNLSFCNFIFARLLDNKTALEVTKHLYEIKNTLHEADKDFFQLFPVILTDNGGEFARVDDIEMDVRGESKLFFCDPNRSDQKGRIEKNHILIRDILPKGTSFDNLTQEDINLVCSHVNSVKRVALNGKSAYELFAFTYGEEIPKLLGISKIPAEDVCQSSKLLQHKF